MTRRHQGRHVGLVGIGRAAMTIAVSIAVAAPPGGRPASAHEAPDPPDGPDAPVTGPQGAVGQFAVECGYSHSASDDPIVHPGHSGMSHLHDFFGNESVTAGSTYESMLDAPTTCRQQLDTASYWAPALLDGEGAPIRPVRSVAYYRVGGSVDPVTVESYPPGLMMVAGNSNAVEPQPTTVVAWSCDAGGRRDPAPPRCDDNVSLRLLVTFPDCWDGQRLDSDDHRSHVAYSRGSACGLTHPVPIPQLQFAIDYPPVADPSGLALASGDIVSAHADFWNTWDQGKLESEVDLCLRQQHVCSISG